MGNQSERQQLDKVFRDQLYNASVEPGADGWNRLQQRLGHTTPETEEKVTRLGQTHYWRLVSGVAACLLLAFLGYRQLTTDTVQNPVAASLVQKGKIAGGKNGTEKTPEKRATTKPLSNNTWAATPTIGKALSLPETARFATRKQAEKSQVETPIHHIALSTRRPEAPETQVSQATPVVPVAAVEVATAERKPPIVERVLVVSVSEPIDQLKAATSETETTSEDFTDQKTVQARKTLTRVLHQLKRLKEGEVLARADEETASEETGLFNRLVQVNRFKINQDKQQK